MQHRSEIRNICQYLICGQLLDFIVRPVTLLCGFLLLCIKGLLDAMVHYFGVKRFQIIQLHHKTYRENGLEDRTQLTPISDSS